MPILKFRLPGTLVKFALLLLAGLGVYWFLSGPDEQAFQFRTDVVTRGDIINTVNANGTLNPTEIIDVGTQASGKVSKMYVDVNDEVKTGQVLAEIDPQLTLAALKQAEYSLQNAKDSWEQSQRDLTRTARLYKLDYVAKVDYERAVLSERSARTSYESAKTSYEKEKVNLDYTIIKAPADGMVMSREVNEGQTVTASLQTPTLFKIARDLSKMKIEVSLSEADIGLVAAQQKVNFTVDAYPDRQFTGIIDKVKLNPDTTQGVVTYKVTVNVENEDRKLLPGMTAFVMIVLSEKKDVLKVPGLALRFEPPKQEESSGLQRLLQGKGASSMRRSQGFNMNEEASAKQSVYLLRDGKPQKVEVKIGASDDTSVEILEGDLKEGNEVITGLKRIVGSK